MFKKLDANGDGTVDQSEFSAIEKQKDSKQGGPQGMDSVELFSKIDTDGDGKITEDENEAFIKTMEKNRKDMPPPPMVSYDATGTTTTTTDELSTVDVSA